MSQKEVISNLRKSSYRFITWRTKIVEPIAKVMVKAGLSSKSVSFIRLLFLAGFIYFLNDLKIAFWFILMAEVLDGFDGPVAKLQKKESDYGKFVDMTVDQVVEVFFIIGLIYAGVVEFLLGTYFIAASAFLIVFAMIDYRKFTKTDWLFKSETSYFDIAPRILVYLSFILLVWGGVNIYPVLLLVLNVYMTLLVIYHFYMIGKKYKVKR